MGSVRSLEAADRLLVIFSDVEMGAGGLFDDFPHSDVLGELLLSYNKAPYDELAVEVVFNGDTFDLLKTAYLDQHPRHITRDVALGKLSRIAAAHPKFFEALRTLLRDAKAPRHVHFVVGNHDPELLFPEVQQLIRTLCAANEQVCFPGFELNIGQVHFEHGHQQDPMFRMDPKVPYADFNGTEVLNISWGSVGMLETAIPLQPLLYFHDRLKPKAELLRLIPQIKELLMALFWRYWTRDYWKDYFRSKDPTQKLTWSMMKELAWRFGSQNPEVTVNRNLERQLAVGSAHTLHFVGHQHQQCVWSNGNRKLIQLGCMRNEYMVEDDGKALLAIPKCYAEVSLLDGAPLSSNLLELPAPPAPVGYIPESIFTVVARLDEMLTTDNERAEEESEQKAQEALEAKTES